MRAGVGNLIDLGFSMAGEVDFCAASRAYMDSDIFFTNSSALRGGFHSSLNDRPAFRTSGYDKIAFLKLCDLVW